jgi:hypothetical protein
MLDPNTQAYRDVMAQAYAFAGLAPTDRPLPIRLPRIVDDLDVRTWVDPTVWAAGDANAITRDVFRRLGPRRPAVQPRFDDDIQPTRAIFLTHRRPFDPQTVE